MTPDELRSRLRAVLAELVSIRDALAADGVVEVATLGPPGPVAYFPGRWRPKFIAAVDEPIREAHNRVEDALLEAGS